MFFSACTASWRKRRGVRVYTAVPFTSVKEGSIPITLVLVAALYIGGQIYSGVSSHDNVSHLTHIIGGCVGAGLGYVIHKNKMNRY